MRCEIEHKFLLTGSGWRDAADAGVKLVQGYFEGSGPTVRVRLAGNDAFLTIKGKAAGVARNEYEYAIPFGDAVKMLQEFCYPRVVSKIRYRVPAENGLVWEIDEYLGANAGLFTAEIELPSEDTAFVRSPWLGEDVSADKRYRNRSLSVYPYGTWK